MPQQLMSDGRVLEGVPSNADVPLRRLPKERYISPAFQQLEEQLLWSRVWQMACREDDIPDAGDYFEYRILKQSIIVTRQADGGIKGFHNVCRHRGAELVCGSGHATEFRCPFHAWTYRTDGQLSFVLSPDEFPPTATYSLAEVRVETWGGFVFVNLDTDAEPLSDYLAPVVDILALYGFERMIANKIIRYEVPCNWKVAAEAFMEAYHTAGTHPQLLPSVDDVNSTCDTFGIHSRMITPLFTPSPRLGPVDERQMFEDFLEMQKSTGFDTLDGYSLPDGMSVADFVVAMTRDIAAKNGLDLSALSDADLSLAPQVLLFPNTQLQVTATETLVWRAMPGKDPDSCFLDQWMLHVVPDGAERKPAEREHYADWRESGCGLVLEQDFHNLAGVQRGLHRDGLDNVLLADHQELRIRHLHTIIDRYLGDAIDPGHATSA